VSGIGRRIGILDGSGCRRREGTVLGMKLGRPIVTKWRLCCVVGVASEVGPGIHVLDVVLVP